MRRLLQLLGLAVLFALVAIPLTGAGRDAVKGWQEERKARAEHAERERIYRANEVPPPALPARPGDRDRFPRGSFAIQYVGHHGFAVDTGAGTATKDMIAGRDTTIVLRLADAQVDSLYELCLADRLFDTVQNQRLPQGWARARDGGGDLVVQAGGLKNRLWWSPAGSGVPWTADRKRLSRIVRMIQWMVEQHPAYRALPQPTGHYYD